jgi:hypothetical protein
MGAGSSVATKPLRPSDEVVRFYALCETIKDIIAEHDARLIEKETNKSFKGKRFAALCVASGNAVAYQSDTKMRDGPGDRGKHRTALLRSLLRWAVRLYCRLQVLVLRCSNIPLDL